LLQNLKSKSKCGKEISTHIIFPQILASFSERMRNIRKKNSPFSFCILAKFCNQKRSTNHGWKCFWAGGGGWGGVHFYFGTFFFFKFVPWGRNPGPYSCQKLMVSGFVTLPYASLSPKILLQHPQIDRRLTKTWLNCKKQQRGQKEQPGAREARELPSSLCQPNQKTVYLSATGLLCSHYKSTQV
jgi:hypothetical protein